ncbi:MAG: hypothetical protein WCD35_16300 [Mycobacteriales bacterium]
MIEAALSAFDARRPGVEVLDLVEDSRETGVAADSELVLRFGDAEAGARVTATVVPTGRLMRVGVAVAPDGDELVVALEQLAPSLRLIRRGPTPVVFDDVHEGFVSITGTRPGELEPRWCTAWVRL